MSLDRHYQDQLNQHGYQPDADQQRVLVAFERLTASLNNKPKRKSWLWKKDVEPVQGIYLWGGVGRGKTWLMDLFYTHLSEVAVERHHFHSFMRQVHEGMRQHEGKAAPMDLIVGEMAQRFRVLCLDEFHVIDIGDAMLMRSLLEALERHRISLVTTSNQPPDSLYKNGLQRDSFLPAIEILKRCNQVIELAGSKDYRLALFEASSVYHTPLGEASTRQLSQEFDRLTCETVIEGGRYEVPGRAVRFIKRAGGIIWCDFNALCGPPRWQNDYLELARCHHTVFISEVPRLDGTWDDRTRRFINLVDVFYDRKVKLVISAEASPDELYTGKRLAFEFNRTASRLNEMQSTAYLEAPHLG
ncbi:MAG: AFG1 family ATPase [Candidatus Thiodiazotropha sp. (ex Monitilora ramsayi)]|nr:AFG1 family ATPase [Candidatus Thiodiazotropha sp. (ex Monitilora ramsayi)]